MNSNPVNKLLIGTTNAGKIAEISSVLGSLPIQIITPSDLGITQDVDETGTSYQENALIKAKFYYEQSRFAPTLGEDSGIIIEALKDQLGVHTRRWGAGPTASDQEWIDYFMQVMQSYPDPSQRTAKFISHMSLIIEQKEYHFYGETTGHISLSIDAPLYPGLPLSSVFIPTGFTQVYTALGEDQKNQISHRGKAIAQVANFLKTHYGF
jgi:XTP/dITP diphosphohydrolase